jgi:hypothetical protein
MTRRLVPLVLAALALAPRAASALISVDAFYGLTRPPSASFSAAVAGSQNNPDLIASSLQIAGGDALLHLGMLELGAIVDMSFKSDSASQTAVGALGGVGFDLGHLRLEALGEVGGQRYGDFTKNPDVLSASSKSEWLAYVGLRPGIAYRFDVGPAGFMLGLWGFARWDLNSSDVRVTLASAPSTPPGTVKLGGATIGAVARVGLDF